MKFTVPILFSLVSAVAAVSPTLKPMQRKAQIHMWLEEEFQGNQITRPTKSWECKSLEEDLKHEIQSVKAGDGFRCELWEKADCKGKKFEFKSSGAAALPEWVKDDSVSWKCFEDWNYA